MATHVQRLSKAVRLSGAVRGAKLLDMGCGWGLSSEVAAYLGLDVTAVDINPLFVDLVNRRAARMRWPISASLSAFDDYRPSGFYDVVLFYECLHHAVRPWDLLKTMYECLSMPDGKIVLAGEPINQAWWENWGLRLDALSVYCMRKHGWFESGWSLKFLEQMFDRVGLAFESHLDSDADIGYTIVGSPRRGGRIAIMELLESASASGLVTENDWAFYSGTASFDLKFPNGSRRAWLEMANYRAKPVRTVIKHGTSTAFEGDVAPGVTRILFERQMDVARVVINSDTWRPSDELNSIDCRLLSLHILGVVFD